MNIFERAKLMDIQEKDLEQILDWRNRRLIRNVMYSSDIISMDQHLQWFEKLQNSEMNISKIFYFDQVPYGVLNIKEIDKIHQKCEWGFFIGEDNAPKGIGTILGFTSLNYIFKELLLRKLSAQVLSINERSAIFHEKLGFVQEGMLRQHIKKEDTYLDILLYRLFKEEWEEHSIKIQKIIEGRYL
ncbi:UDP-4-amino-4,6-dideoxy-N-acetyl-beta-L-altrosamine N-acetyltransferase [Metabacillus fastidiosus]|uniref:UDP-4-amino-4, 6-dideoxy-N-acetyl-beta-L-altrosamine N-acetyltransferase n=1 Tax=Metabacillus fastidiosus TaxID=1458 RepID=UPI003D2DB9C3